MPHVPASLIREAGLGHLLDDEPADAPAKPTGKRRGVPNKTELRFRDEFLIPRSTGLLVEFEPLTFHFPGGVRYTPDWVVFRAGVPWEAYEVKGSWKSKNARDSLTRAKVLAGIYSRWLRVYAAHRDDGQWIVRRLGTATEAAA